MVASTSWSRGRAVTLFWWAFSLILPAHPHARPMVRTRRRAGELKVTPRWVKLNAPRRAPPEAAAGCPLARGRRGRASRLPSRPCQGRRRRRRHPTRPQRRPSGCTLHAHTARAVGRGQWAVGSGQWAMRERAHVAATAKPTRPRVPPVSRGRQDSAPPRVCTTKGRRHQASARAAGRAVCTVCRRVRPRSPPPCAPQTPAACRPSTSEQRTTNPFSMPSKHE